LRAGESFIAVLEDLCCFLAGYPRYALPGGFGDSTFAGTHDETPVRNGAKLD
jgi:hypothetical protein